MRKIARIFSAVSLTVLLAAVVYAFLNYQLMHDWYRVRQFQPVGRIAELPSIVSFTDYGQRLFYVHHPELLDKYGFSGKCSNSEESLVLGCYISHSKIYLYDVDEAKLEGVEEVTAAHEMLHAAYDRLSVEEKRDIDAEISRVLTTVTDERLLSVIDSYRKKDPQVVPNELHSIFATEVESLTPALETYYRKYFIDRQKVVAISKRYEGEFTKLKDQVAALDKQLTDLKTRIEQEEASLTQLIVALERERAAREALINNPEQYNLGIPAYNQKVREYNALLQALIADIARYNELAEQRNAIAIEERSLYKALDARLETVN